MNYFLTKTDDGSPAPPTSTPSLSAPENNHPLLLLSASADERASAELAHRVRSISTEQQLSRTQAENLRSIILERSASGEYRVGMIDPTDIEASDQIARRLRVPPRALRCERLQRKQFDELLKCAYPEAYAETGDPHASGAQEKSDQLAARARSVWERNPQETAPAAGATAAAPAAAPAGAGAAGFSAVAIEDDILNLADEDFYRRVAQLKSWELSTQDFMRYSLMDFFRAKGSDYFVEACDGYFRIRFNIDGTATTRWDLIPEERGRELVSALASAADLSYPELRFEPQDARIPAVIRKNGKIIKTRLRFASAPAEPYPEITLRGQGEIIKDLTKVGLHDEQYRMIIEMIARPQGIIVITGPTGSGKTNTLAGIFTHLEEPDNRKIVELADPVEDQSNRRTQIQITKRNPWMRAFHTCLRFAPKVIGLGEVRSQEAVSIAINTALTGHLVLSTFHADSVEVFFTRMREMKIPSDLLAQALNGIVAQRLIRVLCTQCKRPDKIASEALGAGCYTSFGCDACYGSGFRGRTAIAEVLSINGEVKRLIAGRANEREIIETAQKHGWFVPMQQIAGYKIRQGLTTVEEVVRAIHLEKHHNAERTYEDAAHDYGGSESGGANRRTSATSPSSSSSSSSSPPSAAGSGHDDETDAEPLDYIDAAVEE